MDALLWMVRRFGRRDSDPIAPIDRDNLDMRQAQLAARLRALQAMADARQSPPRDHPRD